MKRNYQYLILGAALVFLLYNSVYLEPLDKVKARKDAGEFDVTTYATSAWNLLLENMDEKAVRLEEIWVELKTNPEQICESYGRSLGISNKCFLLLQGEGIIHSIDEEGARVNQQEAGYQIKLATEFIFGNVVRDASGQVPVSDFASIMDFNKVAEAMNKMVREEVVSPFLDHASEGKVVHFIAATTIRKDKPLEPLLEVIPIFLRLE